MRDALSDEARERKSREIWERFLSIPELESAANVLLYASHKTEVHTLGLLDRLKTSGRRISLPVVVSDTPHLVLREAGNPEDLVIGAFGIRVPAESHPKIPCSDIDLVVLPGTAFDAKGWRVGYGGGFYDRLLERSSAFTVGFAFDCQILPEIPFECHDERLDLVVTETRVLYSSDG